MIFCCGQSGIAGIETYPATPPFGSAVRCVWQHITKMVTYDTSMPLCRNVDIQNLSIAQLQECLKAGQFTSTDLVACYKERIKRLNGRLR